MTRPISELPRTEKRKYAAPSAPRLIRSAQNPEPPHVPSASPRAR